MQRQVNSEPDGAVMEFNGMATRPHSYRIGSDYFSLALPVALLPAGKEDFLNEKGGKVVGRKFYMYYPWGNPPCFRLWYLHPVQMWGELECHALAGLLFVEREGK